MLQKALETFLMSVNNRLDNDNCQVNARARSRTTLRASGTAASKAQCGVRMRVFSRYFISMASFEPPLEQLVHSKTLLHNTLQPGAGSDVDNGLERVQQPMPGIQAGSNEVQKSASVNYMALANRWTTYICLGVTVSRLGHLVSRSQHHATPSRFSLQHKKSEPVLVEQLQFQVAQGSL